MITKILRYFYSKTKLGKLLDGNTRLVGFALWLIGYVAQGLGQAALYFPELPYLLEAKIALIALGEGLGEMLQLVGASVLTVGVANAAVKENEKRPPKEPLVVEAKRD